MSASAWTACTEPAAPLRPLEWLHHRAVLLVELAAATLSGVADFASAFDLAELALMFLPFLVLDVPRYFLSDLYVLARNLLPRRPPPGAEEFRQRLFGPDPPRLSVLLPALNEAEGIHDAIASLFASGYPALEVIVVDDGSTDGTAELVEAAWGERVRVFRNPTRLGKSAAGNLALQAATGELVLIIDGDTSFEPGAIPEVLVPLWDPEVGGVSGNLRVRNINANLLTRLQSMEYLMSVFVDRQFTAGLGYLPIVSGAFGAFRAETLREVGAMDVGPGEDADLTMKLLKSGYRMEFVAHATGYTEAPEGLLGFVKQRLRWEHDVVRLRAIKHRDLADPRRFSWRALAGWIEIVGYHGAYLLLRWLWVAWLYWSFGPRYVFHVTCMVYGGYLGLVAIQMLLAVGLSRYKAQDAWSLLLVPLYPFYGGFHNLVRGYAYLEELIFRESLIDPYVPERVREQIRGEKL